MQSVIINGQEDQPIELFKCVESVTKTENGKTRTIRLVINSIMDIDVLESRFPIDMTGIIIKEDGIDDVLYTFNNNIMAINVNRTLGNPAPRLEVQIILNI